MRLLNFIIAEAALELVPKPLWGDPSVRSDSRRRGVEPGGMLLDRSIHHSAMLKLKDGYRRGRPDLIYLTLLNVTSTPLHQSGMARVYIHALDDVVLEFAERVRPPKSYARFRSLMEKTLADMPDEGLVRAKEATIQQLLRHIGTDYSVGLSVQGRPQPLDSLAAEMLGKEAPSVLVGGFPRGHFFPSDVKPLDALVRIDDRPLDAHVVAARVVYEVEKSQRQHG